MRAYIGPLDGNFPAIRQLLQDLSTNPPPYIAVDTESVSLKDKLLIGIGICTPDMHGFFFTMDDPSMPWQLLLNKQVKKIYHNAPYDLERETLGLYGIDVENIEDTAVLCRMINSPVVLSEACKVTPYETRTVKSYLDEYKVKTMLDLPGEVVASKCIKDARATMALYHYYKPLTQLENYKVELGVVSLLLKMSRRGIKLDEQLTEVMANEIHQEAQYYTDLCESLGFNPNSPFQVGYTLSQQGVFLPWKRGKKQPSTNKEALENANHSYAALALLSKKYTRLDGVLRKFKGEKRAYSHFHLDSSTRRITSSDFQLHNLPTGRRTGDIIPKAGPVRRIFLPDSGVFSIFDMSQIELRVLAYFSGDLEMQRILNTPGGDIHGEAQKAMGIPSRVMAKNFVFGGFAYGGSLEVLTQFTGIKDKAFLQANLDKLNARFPVAARWIKQQRWQGLTDGYVTTLYGQKLMLDSFDASQKHIENCAVNWPVQASAAEVFKRVLLSLPIPQKDNVLQVHDEDILDGDWKIPLDDIASITKFYTPAEQIAKCLSCNHSWGDIRTNPECPKCRGTNLKRTKERWA